MEHVSEVIIYHGAKKLTVNAKFLSKWSSYQSECLCPNQVYSHRARVNALGHV